MKTIVYTVILLISFFSTLTAQNPSIQDCIGAVAVCQQKYVEDRSPSGEGNVRGEIRSGETCTDGELNSIWYIFTANADGELGFVITPKNLNDDYDWALFDLTTATCEEVSDNPQRYVVSCNAAGGSGCHGRTGATGASNQTNQPGGCLFGNTPFNAKVPMRAGQTFVLMISNWTGSPNGYELDFGLSSGIGIFDEEPPEVAQVTTPRKCGDRMIRVDFNEFIQCNSIFAEDFRLEGPGGPYTLRPSSPTCSLGGRQARYVDLIVEPAIAARGDFRLFVRPTNNNHLIDICGNPVEPMEYNFTVDVPVPITVDLGADRSLLCRGDTLLIDATKPGATYLWDDGSTSGVRAVTDAGTYGITLTDVCGTGSDEVDVVIQEMPPTVELGQDDLLCPGESLTLDVTNDEATYRWQDGSTAATYAVRNSGVYAVTVTNACGPVSDSVSIEVVPPLAPTWEDSHTRCEGDVLALDLRHPGATYQWSDGSTQAQRQIDRSGNYAVTITTPCEEMELATDVLFLRDTTLELGADTALCPGETLQLSAAIPGATYRWQDGSTAPSFTVSESGRYTLTAITDCQELMDAVNVQYEPAILTDLGRDTFLCADQLFHLDARAGGAQVTYLWEDGSTDPLRRVTGPGDYIVIVTSNCEVFSDTLRAIECEQCPVYLPSAFSPNRDGANDDFRALSGCSFDAYHLRVFDRWGALIFETTDPTQSWDGMHGSRPIAGGVYVWMLDYTVTENGRPQERRTRGDVMVVR